MLHEEYTSEELKELPVGMRAGIKAKRCAKCNNIVYCNDKEMRLCLKCQQ